MMQAKDNKKTYKKGQRVRRKLNDPKNGHAAKNWAGNEQNKNQDRIREKRGTVIIRGSGRDIINAGKFDSRTCVEIKRKEEKSDSRSCSGLLGLLALGG